MTDVPGDEPTIDEALYPDPPVPAHRRVTATWTTPDEAELPLFDVQMFHTNATPDQWARNQFTFRAEKIAAFVPVTDELLADAAPTRNFFIEWTDRMYNPWKYPDRKPGINIVLFPRLERLAVKAKIRGELWVRRGRLIRHLARNRRDIDDIAYRIGGKGKHTYLDLGYD